MWQAPNQRVRAMATSKKREKERAKRRLHIKRVTAELRLVTSPPTEQPIQIVRVLLNDLTSAGVGLFSLHSLAIGQEIALTLDQPKKVYLRGKVAWCQEYDSDSHVLSAEAYSYRIGIHFVFETKVEQESVKMICEELVKTHVFVCRAA